MSAGPSLQVVVVDDDPRVRSDFTALLGLEPDITVTGTAADGDAAVELAARLLPHVVVMDVRMPGRGGIEATRILRCASSSRPASRTTGPRRASPSARPRSWPSWPAA